MRPGTAEGARESVRTRGARQRANAPTASAQLSGVRKTGTPASARPRSDSGASGVRKAASGFGPRAASASGGTVRPGAVRADEPVIETMMSTAGSAARAVSAGPTKSGPAPAIVRSSIGPATTFSPVARTAERVASEGGASRMPSSASRSETVAPPPPVVVRTPTDGGVVGGVRPRKRAGASIRASSVVTRAMPISRR